MIDKIIKLKVEELTPYVGNAKQHPQSQIDAIKKSIEQFGFNDPIAVWGEQNIIVEGHGRLAAAKQLGINEVPCIRLDHMSEEERRAYTIAHNSTSLNSDFDLEKLNAELASIDFDMAAFGLEEQIKEIESDTAYRAFVDKFVPKLTTDDCYTPPAVYETVKKWAVDKYSLHGREIVRPFYPGGDYQNHKYPKNCVVIDNPPFSIASEIINFYNDKKIDYFLFADSRTLFAAKDRCNYVVAHLEIIYENGAKVLTSFRTNLGDYLIETAPDLFEAVDNAQESTAKELTRYEYPDAVITAALLGTLAPRGVDFKVKRGEAVAVSNLDAMKEIGKGLYGSGFILSKAQAQAHAQAQAQAQARAQAERPRIKIELSDREKQMQAMLG